MPYDLSHLTKPQLVRFKSDPLAAFTFQAQLSNGLLPAWHQANTWSDGGVSIIPFRNDFFP